MSVGFSLTYRSDNKYCKNKITLSKCTPKMICDTIRNACWRN